MSEHLRRRSLSTRERLDLFLAAHGRCQRCSWSLTPGTRWEVDHVIPLTLGGRDDADNMQVLCSPCHGGKTRERDVPAIAKTARIRARHLGARTSRRPLPGGRRSRWKKMTGERWRGVGAGMHAPRTILRRIRCPNPIHHGTHDDGLQAAALQGCRIRHHAVIRLMLNMSIVMEISS